MSTQIGNNQTITEFYGNFKPNCKYLKLAPDSVTLGLLPDICEHKNGLFCFDNQCPLTTN